MSSLFRGRSRGVARKTKKRKRLQKSDKKKVLRVDLPKKGKRKTTRTAGKQTAAPSFA